MLLLSLSLLLFGRRELRRHLRLQLQLLRLLDCYPSGGGGTDRGGLYLERPIEYCW